MNMSTPTRISASDYCKLLSQISEKLKSQAAQKTQYEVSYIFGKIAHLPYSPDIESLKGWYLQTISQYKIALFAYDEVLSRFPLHSPTIRRKAMLLKKLDRQIESQELLQLAELLEPENLYVRVLNEDNSKSSSQAQSQEFSQNQIQLNQEGPDKKIWNIEINRVNIDGNMIKRQKSVIFKSQGCLEFTNAEPKNPLTKKKSILKTSSMQNKNVIDKYDETKSLQCSFDITKLDQNKVQGKINQKIKSKAKEIVFSIDDSNKENHTPNESSKIIKRKSSLSSSSKILLR